jgi:hypothetical protein
MTKAAELAKMGEVLTNSQIGGRRNMVINGAMQVAQRGTSFTGVGNGDNGYYLDRFKFAESGSPNGEFTITQASDGPNGFANSMKLDCTTAETSLASNEMIRIIQGNEGQNLQAFKKGTSDAEYMTLSFYVKSNLTGTAIVGLYDQDNTRYNAKSYTIDSANTWERKVLTFQPDTTGSFGDDANSSMEMWFFLQAGSSFSSGTLPSNWESATEANYAVGQTINVASSTNNDFFITGIQLEVGEQATPFEHRSFGEELALCQRYFQKIESLGSVGSYNAFPYTGLSRTSTIGKVSLGWITQLRAAPTITTTAANTFAIVNGSGSAIACSSVSVGRTNVNSAMIEFTVSSGLTVGQATYLTTNNATDPAISVDSEL